jgi:hypothetical protein
VRITWNAAAGAVFYEIWRAADLAANGGTPIMVGYLSGPPFSVLFWASIYKNNPFPVLFGGFQLPQYMVLVKN